MDAGARRSALVRALLCLCLFGTLKIDASPLDRHSAAVTSKTGSDRRALLQRGDDDIRDCALSPSQQREVLQSDGHTWILTQAFLDRLDGDLQTIVHCTDAGDVLLFRTSIQPAATVILSWPLTLGGATPSNANERTTFRCPPNTGAFFVRSEGVVFENVDFEKCALSSGRYIVEVEECDSASTEGRLIFRNVTFRGNRLEDASALYVHRPSCLSVEMTHVAFVDNVCSRACFGRLAAHNVLEKIEMRRNVHTQEEDHPSSLLSLPPGSRTKASQWNVSNNNVTAIKGDGATLHLSASVFEENWGKTVMLMRTMNMTLRKCTFRRNVAGTQSSGAALHLIWTSSTRVIDSVFEDNRGKKGGAIFVDQSELNVERCTFVKNEATGNVRNAGGAIYALGSTLTLMASKYIRNFSHKFGGALYAEESHLRLSDDIFAQNVATDQGGAVHLYSVDDFWMENVTFSDGSAKEGGALLVSRSSGDVTDCVFLRNVAQKGGALRVALMSTINVTSTRFSYNRANEGNGGGILATENSTVNMTDTMFKKNVASHNGGAVALDTASEMSAHDVTFQDNKCDLSGGGVHLTDHSHLAISESKLLNNAGDFGGGWHVTENSSIIATETVVAKCHVRKNGGGMFIDKSSRAFLQHTQFHHNTANKTGGAIRCSTQGEVIGFGLTISNNKALETGAGIFAKFDCLLHLNATAVTDNQSEGLGGGIYLILIQNVLVRLEGIVFRRNGATWGGAIYSELTKAEIKESRFLDDVALRGGSIAMKVSNVTIEASQFTQGSADVDGGCLYVDHKSRAMLHQVVMSSCASKRGGGIFVQSSSLNAEQLIVHDCRASKGGGIFAEQGAAIQCMDCRFDDNHAGSGGGAVSISAVEPQGLTGQFFRCRFYQNTALLGGAIHLLSEKPNRNCEDPTAKCTFVALVQTDIMSNSASAGGAIFASYPKAFRYSCSASVGRPPYNKNAFSSLQPIASIRAPCRARNNTAKNFGDFVGSYARHVHPWIKNNRTGPFTPWNDTFYYLEGHKSGDLLPTIRLNVTDAFGQGPAFGAWNEQVGVTMESEDDLFNGSIYLRFKNGEADISNIATINSPGNYTVIISFKDDDLPMLMMIVNVRECSLGESTSSDGKLCSPCSATEFNFRMGTGQCQPCPGNGNCTSPKVIHPNPGYWHSYPCSEHIQECLTHEACDFKERQQRLVDTSEDILTCEECDPVLSREYRGAQCKKGYKGPLCGSCEDDYGRTRTLECVECRQRYLNVLFYVLAVFLLLVLTSFVIKSNLVARVTADRMSPHRHGVSRESLSSGSKEERYIQMTEHGDRISAVNLEGPTASQDSEALQYLSLKAERTKERLVEIFKISINFFQVVAVAVSLNMNWTSSIIQLLSSVDFLGGAAMETVTLPIDCLLPADASIPRSVLRTVIFMGIPVLVAIFFAVFWVIALYRFAQTWQYFAKRLILSYLVVAYIAYESITKAAINILVCITIHHFCDDTSDASRYWAVDTSVKCYEGSHSVLVGTLGWPVVLLFSLGFPAGLAFALIFVRRNAPEQDVWYNEATGFLYRAYNDRFFFWESMIMLRKSLLAVIVAFGYTLGPNIQGVLAVGVLTAARYFHTLFRPFDQEYDELNVYESASLFVSQLAFIGGLLFNDRRITDEVHVLLTVVLFFAIGGLSFFFLSRILISLTTYSRIALKIKGIDDVESWGSIHVVCAFCSLRAREQFSA